VGVDGSSPFAPTKIGREIKHLTETLSAFFLGATEGQGRYWGLGRFSLPKLLLLCMYALFT